MFNVQKNVNNLILQFFYNLNNFYQLISGTMFSTINSKKIMFKNETLLIN